ncbi:SusC/RagA family TonB-linked outer membrane protein [Cyclobacterium roseum]|uniref:SusC/RagA family TonB-linked outer membrane protein n=1 Tax=Cyclobacterium roseum TaxID=2666137 RepID=UPI001391D7AC|nr:SusC/RagA family TonB-linked outer membrane protein [Cyclobacterium roseum]
MKKRVLKLLLMGVTYTFIGLVFQLLFINMLWATESNAQRVKHIKDVMVRVEIQDKTLMETFGILERKSPFKFVYDKKDAFLNQKFNIEKQTLSIEDILVAIAREKKLKFKQINHNITVSKPVNYLEEGIKVVDTNVEITGKVMDENGEPLPGATVTIEGTSTGTVTDMNGNFSISLDEGEVLVISYIGYQTKKITIENQTQVSVSMELDDTSLGEVVVIGYGTREKKDLTGAISQISSDEITKTASMTPELAMQGRMAGVFVSNPGSDPNARPSIRIRGVSTLGYNDPLYVIDGVPLVEGGAASGDARSQDQRGNVNVFNLINPNDIESISVLKDASATAIYGVRASNGVILITTKRGAKGKPKVSISSRYGVQNIRNDWEVMNTQDYVDTYLEALNNNPAASPDPNFFQFYDSGSPAYLGNSPYYTDAWLEATKVKNAVIQDHNVSITGGNEMSNYAVGAGFSGQENAMFSSSFNRYSAYVNSDHQVASWLKVGESFRFVYSQTAEDGGAGLNTAFSAPWQPLYDPSGLRGYAAPGRTVGDTFLSNGYGGATRNNFLGISELNTVQRDMIRNIGSFYAEASPLEGLRLRGTFSFDQFSNTQQRFFDQRRGIFEANQGVPYSGEGNTYRRRINENINIVKEFLIGYNKNFGSHSIDLILNAMDQEVQWNNTQLAIDQNSPLPGWDQRRIDEGWPREDKGLLYERNPSGLQGYMGRLSYNFDSKYYLDATVRRDGTSKFGPGYKWGTFPSFGAAWRISAENFANQSFIDDLKLRIGWGQTGNQETRDFAFLSLVNFNPVYSLGSGGAAIGDGNIQSAAALGDFPIVDMSWETVTTTNIGIDALLFSNRLSLTVEYYQRYTDGILQAINIPQVIGALSQPVVNLANVDNRGFELQGSFQDQVGPFSYSIGANLTTVRNRVSNLYQGRPSGGNSNRIEEGRPINFLWGYVTDGIFQTEEQVADWLAAQEDPGFQAQKSPGDIRFVDIQGPPQESDGENAFFSPSPDGRIDAFDQTYIGKSIPGYYYGINLGLNYNNFDFTIDFRGMGDVQRIFTNGLQSVGSGGGNYLVDYLDRWTPDNPSNTIPRAITDDPSGNNRIADRHVTNAGFFRFQNFQLGYNVTGNLLSKLGVSNLRAYLMGQNLLVFSPYPGLDPENDTTPTTFILGVNLGF